MTYGTELAPAIAERLQSENISQSELARRLQLGAGGQALISKVLRGETVSKATARRIMRALGLLPQPRRYHRVCMDEAEFAAWKTLTKDERLRRLTHP